MAIRFCGLSSLGGKALATAGSNFTPVEQSEGRLKEEAGRSSNAEADLYAFHVASTIANYTCEGHKRIRLMMAQASIVAVAQAKLLAVALCMALARHTDRHCCLQPLGTSLKQRHVRQPDSNLEE